MVCFHYTCGVFLSWSLHAGFLNCNRRVFRYCIKVRLKYFKVNSNFFLYFSFAMQGVYRSLASIIFITYIVVAIIHKLSFNFLKNCLIIMNKLQIHIKIMTQRQSAPSAKVILFLGLLWFHESRFRLFFFFWVPQNYAIIFPSCFMNLEALSFRQLCLWSSCSLTDSVGR